MIIIVMVYGPLDLDMLYTYVYTQAYTHMHAYTHASIHNIDAQAYGHIHEHTVGKHTHT